MTMRVKPLSAGPGSFTMSMAKTWMKLKTAHEKLSGFFGRIDRRFKAAQPPLPAGSPPLMMVVLAIAIPLVVILAAITVYAQSGTSEEHQALLVEAQQAAALASDTKDAARQRAYWAQALDLVTRAQEYTTTQESRALFEKAQTSLDALDLAGRLNFRPALTEFFPQGVVITHIQSASSGVYLLDQTSGSILRISLNSKGFYELDQEFQCAPGPYGLTTVTKLVDFEVLPANTDNYRVGASTRKATCSIAGRANCPFPVRSPRLRAGGSVSMILATTAISSTCWMLMRTLFGCMRARTRKIRKPPV